MSDNLSKDNASKKDYLGDGVYVEIEGGMIKLTTSDGIEITNTIYLDWNVCNNLKRYIKLVGW